MNVVKVKTSLGAFRFYLLMVCLLSAAVTTGYFYGHSRAAEDSKIIKSLKQSVETLNQENYRLTRQLNILSVDLEVARMANLDIQSDLQVNLGVTSELKKTVSFYQQVMAPELDTDGFEIYSVDVKSRKSRGFFELDVMLMQKQNKGRAMTGTMSFQINGSLWSAARG